MKQETMAGVWGGQDPTVPRLGGRGGSVTLRCASLPSRPQAQLGEPGAGSSPQQAALRLQAAAFASESQDGAWQRGSAPPGAQLEEGMVPNTPPGLPPRRAPLGDTSGSLTRGLGSAWEKM